MSQQEFEPFVPAVGKRVRIVGKNPHQGERGVIVNSPGKMFYGWAIKLDNGLTVGISGRQLGGGGMSRRA